MDGCIMKLALLGISSAEIMARGKVNVVSTLSLEGLYPVVRGREY